MFSNWKTFDVEEILQFEGISEYEAEGLVDHGYALYAVNPVGITYPRDLHNDGAYDPAFS
jgi:hypothetical protein